MKKQEIKSQPTGKKMPDAKSSGPVHKAPTGGARRNVSSQGQRLRSASKTNAGPNSIEKIGSASEGVLKAENCAHILDIYFDVNRPEHCWLSPKTVAKMFDISQKWLGALREGRKDIVGPPYVKLGTGRTSPVLYNLAKLKAWIDSFPSMVNTHGKMEAPRHSFSQFFASKSLSDRWLFAKIGNELVGMSMAINLKVFDLDPEPGLVWLTFWEWLVLSSKNKRMAPIIEKSLFEVWERANAFNNRDIDPYIKYQPAAIWRKKIAELSELSELLEIQPLPHGL